MPNFFRWIGALAYAAVAAVIFFLLATVGLMLGGIVLLVLVVMFFFMRRRLAGQSRFVVFTSNGQTFTTSSPDPKAFEHTNKTPSAETEGCYDVQPDEYKAVGSKPNTLK